MAQFYLFLTYWQAQSQLQHSWTELALISTFPHPPTPPPPGKVPWRTFHACGTILDCWQVVQDQFDHAKFVHGTSVQATFIHATFVHATFVHATSVPATFVRETFVQGQNLVVYNCNHSSLDQTIKFQTSYRAKPKLCQLQLILSLAQLSPSLFNLFFWTKIYLTLNFLTKINMEPTPTPCKLKISSFSDITNPTLYKL